ncbi:MAG: single-stranded-DNA-specific exonuclease RecJ [Oscillospiraceae bacterium]|nr:single-stranded-DNA-specific exonuclease RecJ [Oscillospiraceae bacterium]
MKYGIWNVAEPKAEAVNGLAGSGHNPLLAMILASRGVSDPQQARDYLDCDAALLDPYLMTDMTPAVERVKLALARGERIAVFGDYDVDGVTATCLLTDFLRRRGADCLSYIPGRLEEGYGLNPIAIHSLHQQGVKLIITVDCGITAMDEALLCKELGIDLVITDHHECKDTLPEAVAVIDPHRPDGGYPHMGLSGVGVAFKLAAALSGNQEETLNQYADMVCLGTVADVMPMVGENRRFVNQGLELLRKTGRPGIATLMNESGCDPHTLNASSVGYMLAPRINAAGRMGQIEVAVELFLTEDPLRAQELARTLCEMNKERQAVESEIYRQATEMLPQGQIPEAIVLADECWHQGVVGIVASRMAEEYCCPTFLICLDGDHGKASSRSYGGFNLFSSLTSLSHLLESYGGHELAAGFTIHRDQIAEFRRQICALAKEFYTSDGPRTVLNADCAITPELLTLPNVQALSRLEPCGNCCPKPLLVMEGLTVERVGLVGGGKHMRLQLRRGRTSFNGIFFSETPASTGIAQGDVVDAAFIPQVNEFRGEHTVQMNLQDLRPSCRALCDPSMSGYEQLRTGHISREAAEKLLPDRNTLATVWRYLASFSQLREDPMCLCRKIVRWSDSPLSLGILLTCLDIFRDVGLLELCRHHKYLTIKILPRQDKADLNESQTMRKLKGIN